MAHGWFDIEARAQERACHFGNELFAAIVHRSERAVLVAIEAGGMACPVAEFMKGGPVPVDRLVKVIGPGNLHIIVTRIVECTLPADPEIGSGCFDQRVRSWQDQARGNGRGRFGHMVGKAVALLDIEYRKLLEKRNTALCVPLFGSGRALFCGGHEAMRIEDRGSMLAAPHGAARALRLPKGKEIVRSKAAADDCVPQGQDVDAAIGASGGGVARHAKVCAAAAPGLHPWHPPAFKICDDPVSDVLVEVGPRIARAGRIEICHISSPLTGQRRATLAAPSPSPDERHSLTLAGRPRGSSPAGRGSVRPKGARSGEGFPHFETISLHDIGVGWWFLAKGSNLLATKHFRLYEGKAKPKLRGNCLLNSGAQIDLRDVLERRKLGAYYTPATLSKILADWAICTASDKVLEPSFGGCGFLQAACERYNALGSNSPQNNIYGCDIDPVAFQFLASVFGAPTDLERYVQGDFLDLIAAPNWPEKFNAVLANPPYIPYQLIATDQRKILSDTRWPMPGLGGRASLWAYFVAKSVSMLGENGRMALVLPGAFLHANYAQTIRDYLANSFKRCAAFVIRERIFLDEGADEETVVVLAEGHKCQPETGSVHFSEVHSLKDLTKKVANWSIKTPRKTSAMSSPAELCFTGLERQLIKKLTANKNCGRFGAFATVQVGVVTGANEFFVLSKDGLEQNGLKPSHCLPILSKFHGADSIIFENADQEKFIEGGGKGFLIDSRTKPNSKPLAAYFDTFDPVRRLTTSTFKKRQLWSAPNDGKFPDAFFPVMHHAGPRLVLNASTSTCTNTVHRVYFDSKVTDVERKLLAISMLTSFSQVRAEFVGRRYGSGVLKHEPREAENIEVLLPKLSSNDVHRTFTEINSLLRGGRAGDARLAADEFIYLGSGLDDWWRYSQGLNKFLAKIRARRQPDRSKTSISSRPPTSL